MSDEMEAWIMRTFGSTEAYFRSLPARHWAQTSNGWASHARSLCDDECEPVFLDEVSP